MHFDTASIADLFADLVVVGTEKPEFGQVERLADSYTLEVGGSAAIFATQVAKLGGRAALVGLVGGDWLGQFVRTRLAALGVDATHIGTAPSQATPLGLNLTVGDDRAMLTVLGALRDVGPDLIPPNFTARHWHIAGYFLLESLHAWWPGFVRQVKANGSTISLDSNWAPRGNWSDLKPLLPLVHLFMPNEKEALALTGETDVNAAGQALARQTPMVVIKRGADGASAYWGDNVRRVSAPTDIAGAVADTTGAGDNFAAGFVWAWLQDKPIDACLRLGVRCGTSSTRQPGGVEGQLRATDLSP
jgi:ribokinase